MASKMAASVWSDLRNCANSSSIVQFSSSCKPSFQIVLWSVSPSELLPDNFEFLFGDIKHPKCNW